MEGMEAEYRYEEKKLIIADKDISPLIRQWLLNLKYLASLNL